MYTDSIEYLADDIYHYKTKEYFNEVFNSYSNGNNRSAIVMLYSVVVCDLVYKLQELEDKYNDKKAKSILDKVKKEQEKDPGSSAWERILIEGVFNKTSLLEIHDKENISHLKKHRNLSAHPVLDQLDILFKPSKEDVRAHIRNMLEGILCKSPLISSEILVPFLLDLESVKDILITRKEIKRYLESKYFNKMNNLMSQKLFKELWKIVFRTDDERCNENRHINFKALFILFERHKSDCIKLIQNEQSYFSQIILENDLISEAFQVILSIYPTLYELMAEELKVILVKKAKTDVNFDARSVYLSKNINEHFEKIFTSVNLDKSSKLPLSPESIDFLYEFCVFKDSVNEFLDFMILIFKKSYDYDAGDIRFTHCINPYIDKFSLNQFEDILDSINKYTQLSMRTRASIDNARLKGKIKKIYGEQMDFDKYPNFKI
ncbi:hypothetical protein [Bacillus cereus group sp. BfR-BA-01394]|uniref:hypothetical protein n=1 Tax=Bacillus cereus group sp. BfR-BA-01394 TaxID=2920331 RepID=UPI001F56B802